MKSKAVKIIINIPKKYGDNPNIEINRETLKPFENITSPFLYYESDKQTYSKR